MTSSRCPMPIWPIKNVQLTNILFVERCNFHYRICPNVSERSRPFPTEYRAIHIYPIIIYWLSSSGRRFISQQYT